MKYCMIETAIDNKEEAELIVKTLLTKKLISSCQIVESNSTWHWNNELECTKEYLLFMKTKYKLTNNIYEEIKKIHSYDCFEFAVFKLESCNQDYLNWIDNECI